MENMSLKQQVYKYNILAKLHELSVKKSKIAFGILPDACGVSKRTFTSYCYIKIEDKNNISPDKLMIIADYLKCSIEELINTVNTVNYEKLEEHFKNQNGYTL